MPGEHDDFRPDLTPAPPDDSAVAESVAERYEEGRPAVDLVRHLHPTDIADVIERLSDEDKDRLFEELQGHDVDLAADVLLELGPESLGVILEELDRAELSGLIREMDSDDAADVVARLGEQRRSEVIHDLPAEDRHEVAELLKYPENSAGGIMRKEFLAVPVTDTVGGATDRIRRAEPQEDEPPIVYLVDDNRRLEGFIRLRDLLRRPAETPLREIVSPVAASVHVFDDQEEVAELARKYDYSTVAVLDESDRLAGIVTADDILDVVVDEASEDIAKLGQATDFEEAFAPVRQSIRGRVPWLFVSLVGGILASFVVLLFRDTVEGAVVIATFMPIIAGMGGAAGNQSTNIVVRALALGEVAAGDIGHLLWKQARVGLVAGLATGLVAGAVGLVIHRSPLLGALVFVAMVLNVTVGATLGSLTPMVLARMGRDPALASSLLLTMTTDMVGIFILLGMTTLALHFFSL